MINRINFVHLFCVQTIIFRKLTGFTLLVLFYILFFVIHLSTNNVIKPSKYKKTTKFGPKNFLNEEKKKNEGVLKSCLPFSFLRPLLLLPTSIYMKNNTPTFRWYERYFLFAVCRNLADSVLFFARKVYFPHILKFYRTSAGISTSHPQNDTDSVNFWCTCRQKISLIKSLIFLTCHLTSHHECQQEWKVTGQEY